MKLEIFKELKYTYKMYFNSLKTNILNILISECAAALHLPF